jgi:hypothetical protein
MELLLNKKIIIDNNEYHIIDFTSNILKLEHLLNKFNDINYLIKEFEKRKNKFYNCYQDSKIIQIKRLFNLQTEFELYYLESNKNFIVFITNSGKRYYTF